MHTIRSITVGLTLQIRPRVGSDGVITVVVDITRSDRDEASGTVVPDGTGNTVVINDIVQTTAQSILSVGQENTAIAVGAGLQNRPQGKLVPWREHFLCPSTEGHCKVSMVAEDVAQGGSEFSLSEAAIGVPIRKPPPGPWTG